MVAVLLLLLLRHPLVLLLLFHPLLYAGYNVQEAFSNLENSVF